MTDIKVGARWDIASQNARFEQARARGLLEYAEVNCPVPPDADVSRLGLPIFAHTSNNPVASVDGVPVGVAERVKAVADASDSPWIGEHLAWLSPEPSGALGYVFTPLLTEEFVEQAAYNVRCLRGYYGRPVALELAPVYCEDRLGSCELRFLDEVARRADARIILDLAHLMISNNNLQRPLDYGLDLLDPERIIELHVAGMRQSKGSRFWHDAHGLPPSDEILSLTRHLVARLPSLKAVTLEHSFDAPEADFYVSLERLRGALS